MSFNPIQVLKGGGKAKFHFKNLAFINLNDRFTSVSPKALLMKISINYFFEKVT